MVFEGQVFGVRMANAGQLDQPGVTVSIFSADPVNENQAERLAEELVNRFAFGADIAGFVRDVGQDELLRPALGTLENAGLALPF